MSTRAKPWSSTAFRLALQFAGLMVLTMAIVLAVFYVQTVGVLRVRVDRQAETHLKRLVEHAQKNGQQSLEAEIRQTLEDGVNTDTEIIILMDGHGAPVIGNASVVPQRRLTTMGMRELKVRRGGHIVTGRVSVAELPSGQFLAVGTDMQQQRDMEDLVGRASLMAAVIAFFMAIGGALTFRRVVDERAAAIRSTMARVAAGDLSQRIPVAGRDDEFTLLNRDINSMLDRLEQLMEGIRHVSNTIAHNLRTPLTRITLQLRNARQLGPEEQAATLARVSGEVEELGVVFDKLLQIAEVESGTSRASFAPVDINALLLDVAEFYEPLLDDGDGTLQVEAQPGLSVLGDGDLIASAVANLLDNAIKYGGSSDAESHVRPVHIVVTARRAASGVEMLVQDNGPGVDPQAIEKMTRRFFRARKDRSGYGLGLASVNAIVQLHGGRLDFTNLPQGLQARIWLPELPAPMAVASA
ncbi:HAMP domain-containing sensor histidine kinase [Diaphorobacter caeni]|uniref:HAMP domain-containing sensor histidine kinase n=1 Tax=Diaphorobacter caeni TaxID=2784387 RepID=UPI00188F25B3|nr:HAMP domain-containing sensor histidine kinase [Diaphorobacter caeni]MBF5005092.1 HAMP domain-containing histidine kinase [Diaphorobacter caeni]